MVLPFIFEEFSSQIATALVTALVLQTPRLWRAAKARIKPDPSFHDLRIFIRRGELRVENRTTGSVELYLEIFNLSRWDANLELFQLSGWLFDGTIMPQADVKASPPRVTIRSKGTASLTNSFRLHQADVERIAAASVQSANLYSSPNHSLKVYLICVLKRRFATVTLLPRELDAPVQAYIAAPLANP
jgi:hypothetical protein